MFNKLKQIKDLRNQAKTMQNALAGESITVEKNGVKLIMNGNLEVTSLSISQELSKESMASVMKDLINEAIKKNPKTDGSKNAGDGGIREFWIIITPTNYELY